MNKEIPPEFISAGKISKPLEDITWFSNLAREGRDSVVYTAGSTFSTRPQTVYFLTKGIFRLYREGGDILIHTVESPSILGIVEMFYSTEIRLNICCETDCEFILMDSGVFYLMVEQTKGWKNVARLLSGYLIAILESHRRVFQRGTYLIMRELIMEYSVLSEEARGGMPLYAYIIKRSGLSRSGVMNILSVLNRKGYIRTSKGYLVEIVTLPPRL